MNQLELFSQELWKDIPNYEGYYQVSNLGKVKSLQRKWCLQEKILKGSLITCGYVAVQLCKDRQIPFLVHRLVAEVFIPKIDGKDYIDHINGIKTDNRLVNLRRCTHRENMSFDNHNRKITKESKYVGGF